MLTKNFSNHVTFSLKFNIIETIYFNRGAYNKIAV